MGRRYEVESDHLRTEDPPESLRLKTQLWDHERMAAGLCPCLDRQGLPQMRRYPRCSHDHIHRSPERLEHVLVALAPLKHWAFDHRRCLLHILVYNERSWTELWILGYSKKGLGFGRSTQSQYRIFFSKTNRNSGKSGWYVLGWRLYNTFFSEWACYSTVHGINFTIIFCCRTLGIQNLLWLGKWNSSWTELNFLSLHANGKYLSPGCLGGQ